MLSLSLAKPGDTVGKLKLSLMKAARFTVELSWDTNQDLDAHALLAVNDGNGAKVSALEQILSTHNCRKTTPAGILNANPDGSFSTPCGSLTHSGDSRSGVGKDIDECIVIDGAKVPNGINEIPVFVTIYDAKGTFAGVGHASITIKDDSGKVLGEYQLTNEFANFNAVQMGSLMLNSEGGWDYAPVGSGFMGDFNTVLGSFS